jgi:hypothetical protein
MAAGDSKIFNEFVLKERNQTYGVSDVKSLAFISNTFASVSDDLANPNLSSVTVTSGGNVAAAYTLGSAVMSRTTNVIKFDATDIGTITKNALNPADVRCAVVYNNTSAADDLIQIYDMTANGTTAVDLVNNDFVFNFGTGGINTATV